MKLLSIVSATSLLLGGCAASQHAATTPPAAAAPQAEQTSDAPKPLPKQPTYATPVDAATALDGAAKAKDLPAMAAIVGLSLDDVQSLEPGGEPALAARFAFAYEEFHRIVIDPKSPDRAQLFIGKSNYPVASPLVREDGRWFFDSAGGKQALIARLVGENELNTIGVCRAYVQAQYEYYSEDRNADDVLQYAQQLASTPGKHDGLYWKTSGDEPQSPLGPLVAQAKASGHLRGRALTLNEPKPYHGYLFRILTAQGPHAPGGAHDYIINGRMVAGFALIAYPARYGKTGVMTFEVGANGKVYEKDLGPQTADAAAGIAAYDPDQSWSLVQE
jgi:hypothetical protein